MIRLLFIGLIQVYRHTLSPLLAILGGPGSGCRFEPSCSVYCIGALRQHGVVKGLLLGMRRICRCHPWGGGGFDPVPPGHSCHSSLQSPAASIQPTNQSWTGKLG